MTPHPRHPGVDVRVARQPDGSVVETFCIRWTEPGGGKPRRSFDSLQDALDFRARRQSAKRWRPEELRQERAGRITVGEFFVAWWEDYAVIELKRSTLSVYRCLWEAHAEPRWRRCRCVRSTRRGWCSSARSC
jgi:hypothetical protein